MIILVVLLASCAEKREAAVSSLPPVSPPTSSVSAEIPPQIQETSPEIVREQVSRVFLEENTDATDGGVERLIAKMEAGGQPFYRTADEPDGLITADDVVLLKINSQWAERGGTNTDLILAVAKIVAAHPEGFVGEIVVADNGQAQFGSNGTGGSLDWAKPNSANRDQSALDVVNMLKAEGLRISGYLWDSITMNRVDEFSSSDMNDGFVVEDGVLSAGLEISYPKFTTEYGSRISFKNGVWQETEATYQSEKLKVINMPVLKSHGIYHVTGAVKSYMGVAASRLTGNRPHNSVGSGGMGALMAGTRAPVLNIMDMIWLGAGGRGPGSPYDTALPRRAIAAGTDPVALDFWAAQNILLPELPESRAGKSDPAGDAPGSFGHWLRLSAGEMESAGLSAIMDKKKILLIK